MINEREVPAMMDKELPIMQSRLNSLSGTLYRSVKIFADYTKSQIEQGNILSVKKCFALADKMLCEGDMIVNTAVRNIYLYSVSKALEIDTITTKICRSLMSEELKKEYFRQLYATGS